VFEVEVEACLQQYSQPVSKGFPWRQVWDHWLTQVNTGQLNFGMASVKVLKLALNAVSALFWFH